VRRDVAPSGVFPPAEDDRDRTAKRRWGSDDDDTDRRFEELLRQGEELGRRGQDRFGDDEDEDEDDRDYRMKLFGARFFGGPIKDSETEESDGDLEGGFNLQYRRQAQNGGPGGPRSVLSDRANRDRNSRLDQNASRPIENLTLDPLARIRQYTQKNTSSKGQEGRTSNATSAPVQTPNPKPSQGPRVPYRVLDAMMAELDSPQTTPNVPSTRPLVNRAQTLNLSTLDGPTSPLPPLPSVRRQIHRATTLPGPVSKDRRIVAHEISDDDEDMKAAIRASLADMSTQPAERIVPTRVQIDDEDDADLRAAIAASLTDVQKPPCLPSFDLDNTQPLEHTLHRPTTTRKPSNFTRPRSFSPEIISIDCSPPQKKVARTNQHSCSQPVSKPKSSLFQDPGLLFSSSPSPVPASKPVPTTTSDRTTNSKQPTQTNARTSHSSQPISSAFQYPPDPFSPSPPVAFSPPPTVLANKTAKPNTASQIRAASPPRTRAAPVTAVRQDTRRMLEALDNLSASILKRKSENELEDLAKGTKKKKKAASENEPPKPKSRQKLTQEEKVHGEIEGC
jgi:hypothetical protein